MKKEHVLKIKVSVMISAVLFWILAGTVVFHIVEDWSWIQSLYYSVVTLTTVGYGDVVPTTDLSRLVAVVYILFGVAIMLASLTSIGRTLIENRPIRRFNISHIRKRKKAKK